LELTPGVQLINNLYVRMQLKIYLFFCKCSTTYLTGRARTIKSKGFMWNSLLLVWPEATAYSAA